MPLSLAACQDHVRDTLGNSGSGLVSIQSMIDTAGEYLVASYPWKWLVRPPAALDLRGTISFTGASWVDGTLTLTAIGAFTNYTWRSGDQVVITAGTNTTLGTYNVASRVSADAITLTSSIGATASAVAGTLSFPFIVLPSDFAELLAIQSVSLSTTMQLTTYQTIVEMRASQVGISGFSYYGAILWRGAFTEAPLSEKAPVPRIEIYSTPTANETAAFSLIYRAGWPVQADDANFALLPSFVEPLYVQLLRAVARGFDEEDEGSMSRRLTEVMSGPLFLSAKRRDDMIQRNYGRLGPGALASASGRGNDELGPWLTTEVGAPSSL